MIRKFINSLKKLFCKKNSVEAGISKNIEIHNDNTNLKIDNTKIEHKIEQEVNTNNCEEKEINKKKQQSVKKDIENKPKRKVRKTQEKEKPQQTVKDNNDENVKKVKRTKKREK